MDAWWRCKGRSAHEVLSDALNRHGAMTAALMKSHMEMLEGDQHRVVIMRKSSRAVHGRGTEPCDGLDLEDLGPAATAMESSGTSIIAVIADHFDCYSAPYHIR